MHDGRQRPVQLHAIVDGKHLYFRARHQHWAIAIAETENLAVCGEPHECYYYATGQYGTDHEASYLPDEHAIAIIQSAIQIFTQVRLPETLYRLDPEGRDVTDLPGLWDEGDTFSTEPPIKLVATLTKAQWDGMSIDDIHKTLFPR